MRDIAAIQTTEAPAPAGHYSQGIACGDLVFVSGQLPVRDGGDHSLAQEGFEPQARRALANLLAVLKAGGATPRDVLRVTIYLSDVADWPSCNAIYAEFFGDSRPARTIVPVGPLHYGYRIEVDAIARRR